MSRWIDALIAPLIPSFGGFVTFCEDPDGLLELAEVREAIRSSGMEVSDWDGSTAALQQWRVVSEDDRPLVIVRDSAKRRLADSVVPDNRWVFISVGGLMPRFSSEVIKSVPTDQWDRLMVLHDQERYKKPPQETAILIGRAIYGVDPEYLKHGGGWVQLLLLIAANGNGLPLPLAKAIAETVSAPEFMKAISVFTALTEPSAARSALMKADEEYCIRSEMTPAELALMVSITASLPGKTDAPELRLDLNAEWKSYSQSADGVLAFGLIYSKSLDQAIETEDRIDVNRKFGIWLKSNYGLIQNAPNPAILRLPTLLGQLDYEAGDSRLLLIVVDAMGIYAWNQVKTRWINDHIIGNDLTRSAFAVLPTITVLSRRAIFEGKLPVSFSRQDHSQTMERKLWKERFGADAEYFNAGEAMGISDALALGKRRVCVIDTTWDKMGHSIDPHFSTIKESARTWAGRTRLRNIIQRGLDSGYRVILTADHGQVECYGKGRPSVGVLPSERSKRVMLFSDEAVCRSFESEWSTAYTPTGLAKNTYCLFADGFNSFDLDGAGTVSHGGMSLDEALVPVAEVFA